MTVSASRSFQRDVAETSRCNENGFPLPIDYTLYPAEIERTQRAVPPTGIRQKAPAAAGQGPF
jgi:hypothetical protein